MPPARDHDEVRLPVTEAIKLLAREAGFAAGKELLKAHSESCEALKTLPEIKDNIGKLKEDVSTIKRAHRYIHWLAGAVGGGMLWAFGEWLWTSVIARHVS